jgi:hypothetical protein
MGAGSQLSLVLPSGNCGSDKTVGDAPILGGNGVPGKAASERGQPIPSSSDSKIGILNQRLKSVG